MRIDLHTHSRLSDGTSTPQELMSAAVETDLDVVAITDHDTTAGWRSLRPADVPLGLTVVGGAEFSCVARTEDTPVSVHLLGLLFDPDNAALAAARTRLRASRIERAQLMVARFAADGARMSWDEVAADAGDAVVGRPHIARALVRVGWATGIDDAFTRYLGQGSRYWVAKTQLDVIEAIGSIRAAGGVSVFAHPRARRRGSIVADDVIVDMAAAGLGGVEVDHVDHDEVDRTQLRILAADLGLITTGSSDFHGSNKTVPMGACTTPPESYQAIVTAASGAEPISGTHP